MILSVCTKCTGKGETVEPEGVGKFLCNTAAWGESECGPYAAHRWGFNEMEWVGAGMDRRGRDPETGSCGPRRN